MSLFGKDRDLTKTPDRVELAVEASFFQEVAAGFHIRLDQFLAAHLAWRSRSSIQELVREGYVLVDLATPESPRGCGREEVELRPGRKLHQGSRVVVVIPQELRLPALSADPETLAILYEDEEVVAVDKPPMLAVHPSGRHLSDTLIQRVHAHYLPDVEAGRLVPRLCHRLDRETSGIVLISKNPRTHHKVMRQFERRRVEKDYLAIVHGELTGSGTIDYPLAPARASTIALKMAAAAEGLPCRTDWSVIERHEGYTLLRCRLHTGRQHQIRVHLAAIGHPIVGDKLYGPDESLFQRAIEGLLGAEDRRLLELPRHALHNHRLVFLTPAGGARIEVVSPLASDLRAFLDATRP